MYYARHLQFQGQDKSGTRREMAQVELGFEHINSQALAPQGFF